MKLTKTDKKEIKLWIKALRSGKYKQTEGTLENGLGYCCLGVACRLFTKNPKTNSLNQLLGYETEHQPHGKRWLNLIDLKMGCVFGISLMGMNDDLGYSFNEIADVIDFFLDNGILE